MRPISEIILHCTATAQGREVSVASIRAGHLARNFADIGYHFVIGLDGTIHPGRPIETAGAHTKGHNERSIGICYVGGYAPDGKTPMDTRTDPQRRSMERLVKELLLRFPGATVHGHYEFAPKDCPCFDVAKWLAEVGIKQ